VKREGLRDEREAAGSRSGSNAPVRDDQLSEPDLLTRLPVCHRAQHREVRRAWRLTVPCNAVWVERERWLMGRSRAGARR